MQALDWYDELERIAGNATKLSPSARRAVKDVVVSILSEGARYPLRLERVVTELCVHPAEPAAMAWVEREPGANELVDLGPDIEQPLQEPRQS